MAGAIGRLALVQRQLLPDLGREPAPEELAAGSGMTPQKVTELCRHGREPVSLPLPLGQDGDSELGDLIGDTEAILPARRSASSCCRSSWTRCPACSPSGKRA